MRRLSIILVIFCLLFLSSVFSKDQVKAEVSADITPPEVSISSPSPNSTVSGTVTVSASASDPFSDSIISSGLVGVQFRLDGAVLGLEVLVSPYSYSWDTTAVANGAHTISAVARDLAGNSTISSSVSFNVNNTPDPTALPTITYFTATPATIAPGGSSNLRWAVSNATIITIDQGINTVTDFSRVVYPTTTTSYMLTASNNNGSVTASVTVTVSVQTTTPPPTTTTVTFDQYPTGTIFKKPNDPTVYIKEGTVARPITDWTVYQNQVPSSRTIITVPDSLSFTSGDVMGLRSGTLIKASNDPTVYLIVGDQKRPFSSENEFKNLSYSYAQVYSINDPTLVSSIPTTTGEFSRPFGTVFRYAATPAIYFLNSLKEKRAYPSMSIFKLWNNSVSNVITIPASETYPDGPVVQLPDGMLVKGSSPAVYMTFDFKLRPFTSSDAFLNLGYHFSDIVQVPDSDLSLTEIGTEMK